LSGGKSNALRAGVKGRGERGFAAAGLHECLATCYTDRVLCEGGGNQDVIYLIYKDGEILVETDDIEFVKSYISQNQECSVHDARTGKKVPVE
jgi:hypothetical protein